ncbi:ectonucleoside triphosphate diphosphohydrolase 5 isoform X1 [Colossoma macropomum]|uniref:ectonucleoside triphosphate diphosphohydrolase 5 isoform X1 n=2 Tax=Colossoma macropomum TaxID=42526 RepID=UPI0018655049|nr:ectonucleoside triphosphate diphosphohydrolase 5 isoform X1 [Colossoma macropomum]XP_036437687.1 ectonucleoside triphosphate diphosphohydrolase 5 isoform X1 [Colossoma macropomum]
MWSFPEGRERLCCLASVRMSPALHLLLLWILLRDAESQGYVGNDLDFSANFRNILHPVTRPANASRIFYGIMFDAGSTGTRIHVYTFIQKDPEGLPVLDNEMFRSTKPGLSAYVNNPENAGHSLKQLLVVAKNTVPRVEWKRTPVVLRATAGLRNLPPAKAHALLEEVRDVLDDSPFYVPADSVSMMNGTNEGIFAWLTINFLTGHLGPNMKRTVGILDLGGGSTQITFLPKSEKTIENVPADYKARFSIFSTTHVLYTHSYPKNGIKEARIAAIGALGSEGTANVAGQEWKVYKTACLPKNYIGEFSFGGVTYRVGGNPEGYTGYKACYQEMLKVVKGIIQRPHELKDRSVFYAFSYYFDHAVEAGLIDENQGGAVRTRDFKKRAKEVCNKVAMFNSEHPFLCMDLTYITCLLRDGYGFKENTVLELTKKVNNVEASWALGATISYFNYIKIL